MKFKNCTVLLFIIFCCCIVTANAQNENRFQQIQNKLESLVIDVPGLAEKTDLNVNNVPLSDFLQSLAIAHKVNLNVSNELNDIIVKSNFSNATVTDILLHAVKEYDLQIDFTGSILSIRKYNKPLVKKPHRIIPIAFSKGNLNIELNKDTLYVAFKQIMDKTGRNLVYEPGMEKLLLSGYIQNIPLDAALNKIAYSNGLNVIKTRDGFFQFEKLTDISSLPTPIRDVQNPQRANIRNNANNPRPQRRRRGNFYFQVNETNPVTINVDFTNTSIETIINDIGHELHQNMFTSAPLSSAGVATAKADTISYDLLLDKILENTEFSYKKQDSIYYFGKKEQISLRNSITIPLMHRSIEVMTSNQSSYGRRAGRTNSSSTYNNTNSYSNTASANFSSNQNRQTINTNRNNSFQRTDSNLESLVNMLPEDVTKDLKISVDVELNSFIVSGPAQNIKRFREFVSYIDKPVPVILIEVMLLEVNKSALVETGIEWGIGDKQVETQGGIYPNTNITLGSNTINRIIGGSTFGSWNLGQVIPNFFARIKAMETNGDIKIRSAPRLSALNGHRANLSIGETTYYAITQRDIIGSQNPQTSTITNYVPIDAEFAINIKPLVSGDEQITLDINVIQSNFNGKKVAEDAPPGINSREFNSIIRVRNQDLVILGGLEEKIKNDSGNGVPFLARVPIIKWFFSKKKREDTKKKLTVLIKPTIIK